MTIPWKIEVVRWRVQGLECLSCRFRVYSCFLAQVSESRLGLRPVLRVVGKHFDSKSFSAIPQRRVFFHVSRFTLRLKIALKPHIVWSLSPKAWKYESLESQGLKFGACTVRFQSRAWPRFSLGLSHSLDLSPLLSLSLSLYLSFSPSLPVFAFAV